tara:strand:+ start:1979 stop:2914 length:936 start_codon:yes stop_codon:yes gene_type:complete
MAVRTPLKNDSGNIKQMTSAEVNEIIDQTVYQYSLNPSVTLSVVGSGGNMDAISDTRLQAGAASTSASAFPSEATTAEPSVVTVNYDRLNKAEASISPTTDTGKIWPAYYTSAGHIQAMTITDVRDTFLHPAIDLLVSGSTTTQQAGTYTIATSTTLAGATNVDTTPIYADTRADTSAYTAGGIGETLDQPTTITNYYLHRIDGSNTSFTNPFFINASNHLQEYASATFQSLLSEWIRYTAASSTDGYKITYAIGTSGSGNTRGTAIVDTRLNGSGNYQTRFVGADDYRAQEFPNGSPTTISTYNLRINKS